MSLRYLSICSGIEAASVAWHDLGFIPVGFSEIEPFPCAVLKHRFPNVPNFGDMTKFNDWKINDPIDLLVGGTPCQAFSVAGLRKGLADPRGNLALTFLGIVERFRPRWVRWEIVRGGLSEKSGAFGSFLGGLAELGYGWSYRVLDAQFFGVAQRRRRVFVVGHLGAWQRAAAVLFEPESLRGDSAPSREARKDAPAGTSFCPAVGGTLDRGTPARSGGAAGYFDHMIASETVGTLSDGAHNGGGSTDKTPTLDASSQPARCLTGSNHRIDAETETLIPCTTNR